MNPFPFSIITPSFGNSEWLKLCIPSVADQGVAVEHIVQDAGSKDGTLDWLNQDHRVRAFVEKDSGMYDAINRGLKRAQGEVCAYLNCDEQYLPGTLPAVRDFFVANPHIEILFADFVVVDARGEYLFHRKVQPPLKHHLWVSHLTALSCSMFFRRKLIHEDGLWFNPTFRAAGDGEWVLRLLERRTRMAVMRRFTSVFTMHDSNVGNGEQARRENEALRHTAPAWARWLRPFLVLHHRARRLAGGIYFQRPFAFSLYTRQSPTCRIRRDVTNPSSRWRIPAAT